MRAYLYLLRMQIIVGLTYRFQVFAVIITKVIILVASVFLWNHVYSGVETIEGVSLSQMSTYVILSGFISVLLTHNVQFTVNDAIRQGDIALDMIRPYSIVASYLSKDLGDTANSFITRGIPVFAAGVLIFGLVKPESSMHLLLSVISLILSYGILWFINACVGFLSFWTMELGSMGVVMGSIVRILSGSFIPLWMFPDRFREILYVTPFPYIYQTTLSLYVGKSSISRGTQEIAIQLLWLLALSALCLFIWSRAKKRVLVQGG